MSNSKNKNRSKIHTIEDVLHVWMDITEKPKENCLSWLQAERYIERLCSSEEQQAIYDHLTLCSLCDRRVAGLEREVQTEQTRSRYELTKAAGRVAVVGFYPLPKPLVGTATRPTMLEAEDKTFRWDIRKHSDTLILSLAAKHHQSRLTGKYVVVRVTSARLAAYDLDNIQWKSDGPDAVFSTDPIGPNGRIEIELATTAYNVEKQKDYRILQSIFQGIELEFIVSLPEIMTDDTVKSQSVIEQVTHLLRQGRFGTDSTMHMKGEDISISVYPEWSRDTKDFRVRITCDVSIQHSANLGGLPVFILSEKEKDRRWIVFLTADGEVIIHSIPPGVYQLSAPLHYGRSKEQIPLFSENYSLAAASAPGTKEGKKSAALDPRIYISTDKRVRAILRRTKTGETVAAFETQDESLAHSIVRFYFVRESGEVVQSDEVELKPIDGEERLWEGRWVKQLESSELFELVFEVLPVEK